jgi:hypothetical protein
MILQLITMKQAKLQNKNQNDDENTRMLLNKKLNFF